MNVNGKRCIQKSNAYQPCEHVEHERHIELARRPLVILRERKGIMIVDLTFLPRTPGCISAGWSRPDASRFTSV